MKKRFTIILLLLSVMLSQAQVIRYVKQDGTGNGTSWAAASGDLQAMINTSSVTEIWVAAGTYKPHATNREVSFSMLPNVKIYGGFPNTGSPTMEERNWTANSTILSGDLNSNDVVTGSGSTLSITNNDENSYNVVFNPVNSNLELNGFTISGGNANLGSGQYSKGGGLYIANQLYNSSSANLTNIIFSGNSSTIYGGGLHLRNVPIANLTNVIFDRNISNTGGGIYNENSGLKLKNAIFSGNNVISGGGGGLLNFLTSSTELTNVTFVGNNASSTNGGGGIFNTFQTYPILKNCVFWQNTHNASTTTGNRDIINYGSDVSSTVSNSLLQLPSSSYNASFSNMTTSNNIFAQDPLFVNASNPAGADGIFGTSDDGLVLLPCSPAVNVGSNAANTIITDLAGNNRVFNTTIDMGAYETQSSQPTRLYVNASATGANTGLSWTDAFTDLQLALKYTCKTNLTEIWVAAGTYKPTTGTDRNISFSMINGVAIYGGFPNTGNPVMADRNWSTNQTILSGDIGTLNSIDDNSNNVILNSGLNNSAILNGFTIKGGRAISGTLSGGGMYNISAAPTVINCIFEGNSATNSGGGLFIWSAGPAKISNCVFRNNVAPQGSGLMIFQDASATVTNCTFFGNSLTAGFYSAATINNSIFWGNSSASAILSSSVVIANSIVQNGITGCTNCPGTNGNVDPMFTNQSSGDYTLQPCSPAINAGNNTGISGVDLANNPRIYNNEIVDIGAYEYQGTPIISPNGVSISSNTACEGTSVNLTATCLSGSTVTWYNTATGGTPIGTGSPFSYSAPVGNNQILYASCVGSCETARVATSNTITVNAKPAKPTITAPTEKVVCSPSMLTLSVSDCAGTVTWSQSGATGTSLELSTVGTYSISATCMVNGCTSETSDLVTGLEIKSKPSIPTVIPPSQSVVCSPNSLTLTATCANASVIWSNNSTGTSLTLSAVGTYSISAKCVSNGCESDASDAISLEIKSKPSIPTVTPPSQIVVCSPNSLTLTATCTNASVIWSNSSTGTSLTLSSVGTYSISAKCTSKGCESDVSTPVSLEIKSKPSIPTVTPPSQLVVCSPNSLTLTATCTNASVIWSNSSTGTSLTLNSVGTYSISAKCVSNGCESDASDAISLEIKSKPSIPTVTPPSQIVVCSPNSLTLTATCANASVIWSNNSTGTSLTLSAVGTYSISAKCVLNGCESDASTPISLEIKSKPSIPTVTPPSQLVVCSPNSLTLTATCTNASVIWSNNSTGTSLTLSSVGTYSISAKCISNGCESDASDAVSLEIKSKPSIPTVTPPSQLVVCSPNTLTLTATCTNASVIWSNNSTGTSLTLSAVGTYSISAKCVSNSCESDASDVVSLEIKAKPNVPTVTPPSQLVVCSPNSLTLTATCTNASVIWSNNSTGTSLTLSSVGTYSISAKCTSNGCESDISTPVSLEIKSKPSIPTVTPPSQLVVCSPNSLTLTATCTNASVIWSNSSTGTSLTLSSVGTYSISAKCILNGCESDASTPVSLEIKAKPSIPTVTPPSQLVVCSPNNLTLTATCTNANVIWSNSSTGTSLTLSAVGTYSISAKCTSNGCESDASDVVSLEIKSKPNVPTVTPPSQLVVCSPNSLTLMATCTNASVVWSNNSTGTSLTLSAVGTYSISAKCVSNGCESEPSFATSLEIKALPVVSASNTGPYTVGQSISLIGGGVGTYTWSGPNNFSSTTISPIIANALTMNGGIYTLTVLAQNGCSVSNTTEVIVSGVNPCDPSRIVDYLYVKVGSPHQSLFNLTDGMVINQIPEQVSILVTPSLCPSVTIESFEMNIQGPELNWNILQNVAPNALFDNFGSDIWGRSFKPGIYTLTVTGYAQDNKSGGITYGPKVIRFTVVGNLATINAPTLSKNTICAGSSVDVSFNTTGLFGISNEFRVELSDSAGSFGSPVLLGTTNSVGSLRCVIPQNTLEGTKYLIRVASSNQVVVSNPAISQVMVYPYSYNLVSPTNNFTGMGNKKAVTSIHASNKITSPANVSYHAGKSILLTPGFESGAVFKAEIRGCEN